MILHPHANVIFCDDVRQEINGKLLHIGVYNDDILFDGPLPWSLPQGLFCLISYHELYPEVRPVLAFKVRLETKSQGQVDLAEVKADGNEPTLQRGLLDFEAGVTKVLTMRTTIQLGPMIFQEPAKISVVAIRNGEEIAAGRVRISQMKFDEQGKPKADF